MSNVLWIDNNVPQCGIVQYGAMTCHILEGSQQHRFVRVLASGPDELRQARQRWNPSVIIINSCGGLSWINPGMMHELANAQFSDTGKTIKFVGFRHDYPPPEHTLSAVIDVDPDVGFPRPIPLYRSQKEPPRGQPVIGTFGFGFGNKGYGRLLNKVATDFPDGATLRAHIPFAAFGDHDGSKARQWATELAATAPSNIKLEVSHEFLSTAALIDWLASNHLNAFFYERNFGRGVASTIDYALAARRPIAITDSWQFRHIVDAKPRIMVEQRSLPDILESGLKPLLPYYEKWSPDSVQNAYCRLVDSLESQ